MVEPIARLSLEGGYDSNVLYDGTGGDRTGRMSPDVGLNVRDPLFDVRGTYGGDYLYYERRQPDGVWNHRGTLSLKAEPMRRLALDGLLRASYAFDPVGLAQAGVFRTGRQSAFLLSGRFEGEWCATRRMDVGTTLQERMVVFEDHTGGAMHAPGIDALWRESARLRVGGWYRLGVFQTLDPRADRVAISHGLRARARYVISRGISLDASAGPAFWRGDGGSAVVPEAAVELLGTSRGLDLRLSAGHGLGIGATARPGLVNSFEFGAERRFGRRYLIHADGGIWQSGLVPSGRDAVTGYAVAAEAGALVAEHVRMSVITTHFARVDDPSPNLRRTTVGLRLAWELPAR